MKKFLVGLAAVALLTGTAVAQTTTTNSTDQQITVKKNTATIKKHRAGTTGSGGYTTLPPKHDYGRYSNLPGKDKLNSKAYIEDH
jgi:hypothetical protein